MPDYAKRIICPIDDCEWTYDVPPLENLDMAGGIDVALGLAPGSMRARAEYQRSANTEAVIREHCEADHDIVDWVKELMHERNKVEKIMEIFIEHDSTDTAKALLQDIAKVVGYEGFMW